MATRFKHLRDVTPKPFASTWLELQKELSRHVEREDKTRGSLWSPAVYRQNAKRGNNGVEYLWAVVADLDGESLQNASRRLARLTYLAYTTHSHREGDEHWHVVLPLSRHVRGEDWSNVWAWAHGALGLRGDERTGDPARIYFEPQHAKNAPFKTVVNEGRFLTPPKITSATLKPRGNSNRSPRSQSLNYLLSEDWWNAKVDMSQYDGMTQHEVHRDMQREWAELRARMVAE